MKLLGSFLILFLAFSKLNCLKINGEEYHIEHSLEDGVSKRTIYFKESSHHPWISRSRYNKTYLSIGWDTFDIETNSDVDDNKQAFLAGYLEGVETHSAIYDHYINIMDKACAREQQPVCAQVDEFFATNTAWVKDMVKKHAGNDIYWQQVNLFYQQMNGIAQGYNSVAPSEQKLTFRDIMWMNFMWDSDDIKSALQKEANKALRGNGHCSAIIKILHGNSDILVAHNTWSGYETMRRIMKRYTLPFKQVTGQAMSFPGYPAALMSGDDFYIISSGLVAQETTNGNNNASLWAFVKPVGQVMEAVRVTVANRLADSGRAWGKIFSEYNSGTYNNQWMIVDMKKFSPGTVKPELLWIIEQMPGYVHREDQTERLTRDGYWASYNVPFYSDVYDAMGNQALVKQYGDFFTHDKTPRALIFKRDQEKVKDIHTLMHLMRSNDYEHDPLSRCNCTPPFSSENAIASRNDLNPANGTFPIEAMRHRCHGATDAKMTNYKLSKDLSLLAVSGPTTGAHLPPFRWSKTDFNLQHRGLPDLFNFSPELFTWPNQDRL